MEFNWTTYETIQTYLSTELNSLANDANKLGVAIDNTTSRDFYMMVEAYLASVDLSAQTNPSLSIYRIDSLDGTNYEDGGDTVDPAHQPVAIIPLREVNGAQRVVTKSPIVIPPGKFKLLFENKTGAALAASGNTLKYRIFSEESS